MDLNYLASKNAAILGLGVEGLALASFLVGKCNSLSVLDQKAASQIIKDFPEAQSILNDERVTFISGQAHLSGLEKYDIIFRSPGVKYLLPEIQKAIAHGVEVSSQIKLFFDLCPASIIGVTGTKGKGTTASLIYEIMKKESEMNAHLNRQVYIAGNIGKPAISLIPSINPQDLVILELSSFQLQDLHRSPHIAVVLNISSDHLNYHQNETEYHEAKLPIVRFQRENDYAIINMDYLTSFEFASQTLAHSFFFSGKKALEEGAFVRPSQDGVGRPEVVTRVAGEERVICNSNEIKIFGHHNLENIAAASLAAYVAGANWETISTVAKDFSGLPHRLEYVGEIKGVKIFNDSFATNPEPTIAALNSFSQSKLLILGGSSKGADFDAMAQEIVRSDVKAIALIGDEAEHIMQSLSKVGFDGQIYQSGHDLSKAVRDLMSCAHNGDVLIFSPACASFDMFKNYKDRGEKFISIIRNFND